MYFKSIFDRITQGERPEGAHLAQSDEPHADVEAKRPMIDESELRDLFRSAFAEKQKELPIRREEERQVPERVK